MSPGYIYIASPYTYRGPFHEFLAKDIEQWRYEAVEAYAAFLLTRGQHCYSPIAHCHNLATKYSLPTTAEFWLDYNKTMIERATAIQILLLPTNHPSVGVEEERQIALRAEVPVRHILLLEAYDAMRATAISQKFKESVAKTNKAFKAVLDIQQELIQMQNE